MRMMLRRMIKGWDSIWRGLNIGSGGSGDERISEDAEISVSR